MIRKWDAIFGYWNLGGLGVEMVWRLLRKNSLTFAHIYLTSVIAKDEAVLELSG